MKEVTIVCIIFVALFDCSLNLNITSIEDESRQSKALSLFQVIRFQNGPCQASARMGTCYTSAECQTRNGVSSGTCAGGFGVCCVFTLACGQTSQDNCTYLSRTGSMTQNACQYTICKCTEDVCRIRFDFMSFNLAPPVLGLTQSVATNLASATNGGAIGDCLADRFTITSPGNVAPPQICGFNTGQHMIVDASDRCHVASFNTARASSTYDIKVTQYLCGAEMGGPDGCLQYFTGNTGTIASYNFPTQATSVPFGTTHLSNQCYTMCFRQEAGKCGICYQAVMIAAGQGAFGLSQTKTIAVTGENNNDCFTDYLMIPGALRDTNPGGTEMFVINGIPDGRDFSNRICGRFFHLASIRAKRVNNLESICTSQRPFQITFKTDADELTLPTTTTMPNQNEQSGSPGGITGFNLNWALQDC